MSGKAQKELLRAVLEPRKPGALDRIAESCTKGADPDALCPETSTSMGPVSGGSTLLTHSIHTAASNVVSKLLECGASASLIDKNGWTPWMASTLCDESKRRRIQEALSRHGADTGGEHIGDVARAIFAGNVEQAAALIENAGDLGVLATFRVDLVARQVSSGNTAMLELLLGNGMSPTSTHLSNAIRFRKLDVVDVLLRHGAATDHPGRSETHLMAAAGIGDLAIVKRLVAAGADVNRYAHDNVEWTAAFYARQAGHTDVADWLDAQLDTGLAREQAQITASRDPRFQLLYEKATASESLSTDDIVEFLARWDADFGVTILDAEADRLSFGVTSVPDDIERFVSEVLSLCPEASEWERDLRKRLAGDKTVDLWWD